MIGSRRAPLAAAAAAIAILAAVVVVVVLNNRGNGPRTPEEAARKIHAASVKANDPNQPCDASEAVQHLMESMGTPCRPSGYDDIDHISVQEMLNAADSGGGQATFMLRSASAANILAFKTKMIAEFERLGDSPGDARGRASRYMSGVFGNNSEYADPSK